MLTQDEFVTRVRQIKLFAMDVDGVLTNGQIIYSEKAGETKVFNAKDGHGIAMLVKTGFPVAWITARTSSITERRANELGVPYLFQGAKTKLPVLESLLKQHGLSLSETAYMGDDLPDLPVLKAVGLAICPSDAVKAVQSVCHYVTSHPGGSGAVREWIDLALYAGQAT